MNIKPSDFLKKFDLSPVPHTSTKQWWDVFSYSNFQIKCVLPHREKQYFECKKSGIPPGYFTFFPPGNPYWEDIFIEKGNLEIQVKTKIFVKKKQKQKQTKKIQKTKTATTTNLEPHDSILSKMSGNWGLLYRADGGGQNLCRTAQ